jgi:hypothetical protein
MPKKLLLAEDSLTIRKVFELARIRGKAGKPSPR